MRYINYMGSTVQPTNREQIMSNLNTDRTMLGYAILSAQEKADDILRAAMRRGVKPADDGQAAVRKAQAALAEFDAAHPEIKDAIDAEKAAKRAAADEFASRD